MPYQAVLLRDQWDPGKRTTEKINDKRRRQMEVGFWDGERALKHFLGHRIYDVY